LEPLESRVRRLEDSAGVREIVRDYEWFHIVIGVAGNVAFFCGSLLFLVGELEPLRLWLFTIGSFGMLVGSVGSALVRRARRRHRWARPGSWDDVARRNDGA
jgi:hypothetical protein